MKHEEKVQIATTLCEKAHSGQRRKFSGEPAANHPKRVAALAKKAYEEAGAPDLAEMAELAGLCQGLLEDSKVSLGTLRESLGNEVANLVVEMTDQFTKESAPDQPRRVRKAQEAERRAGTSAMAQTITLCDIIDNLQSLGEGEEVDSDWVHTYLQEKENLMMLLTAALPTVKAQAASAAAAARKSLGLQPAEIKALERNETPDQDVITDMLHKLYAQGGMRQVKLALRGAVANFACEKGNVRNPSPEPDPEVLEELSRAILTPGFMQ
jgi:hypothetical protein